MIKMFSSLLLILSISCFAKGASIDKNSLNNEIYSNYDHDEAKTENGKTYFNPDRLITTEHGIFFQLKSNDYIALPYLLSDSQGCYILSHSSKVTKKCPYCEWERVSGAFKCRNPNCPSNQTKE